MIEGLVFDGGRIRPHGESPTGFVLAQAATDAQNTLYTFNEPVNPCDWDDVARAEIEAMNRIEKYYTEKLAKENEQ